jgi:GST-like protein
MTVATSPATTIPISYPWTVNWKGQGQDIEEFKYFKRWFEDLNARPAVQRGLAVTAGPAEDFESLPPEERERRMKLPQLVEHGGD